MCRILLLVCILGVATAQNTACSRPDGWCTHNGSTYDSFDCDGDGILDHHCSDSDGHSGVIGSVAGCVDTFPDGLCAAKVKPVECTRPSGWCTHSGATYEKGDCDGDGIPDHHCFDSAGNSGVIGSASSCAETFPNGKCAAACTRPNQWCTHSTGLYEHFDCDMDGIRDPVCVDSVTGTFGVIGSKTGCVDSFPNGVCPGKTNSPTVSPTTMSPTMAPTTVLQGKCTGIPLDDPKYALYCPVWASGGYCASALPYYVFMQGNCLMSCCRRWEPSRITSSNTPCSSYAAESAANTNYCPGWVASGFCSKSSRYYPHLWANCPQKCCEAGYDQ